MGNISDIQQRNNKIETQHKLQTIQTKKAVLKNLKILCKHLNIKYCARCIQNESLKDVYWDDTNFTLNKNDLYLRERYKSYSPKKTKKKRPQCEAKLCSNEKSKNLLSPPIKSKDFDIMKSNSSTLIKYLKGQGIENSVSLEQELEQIEEKFHIKNKRTIINIETDCHPYTFFYDRYYYHFIKNKKYSEVFTEIEIKEDSRTNLGKPDIKDQQIDALKEILKLTHHFSEDNTSKYKRGVQLLENPFTCKNIIAFHLSTNKNTQNNQIQSTIQSFSHVLKKCINKTLKLSKKNIKIISYGHALIILFDKQESNIIDFLCKLKEKMIKTQENEIVNHEYKTAIHTGNIYCYTDPSDNYAIAGQGLDDIISMIELAKYNEIIITQNTKNRLFSQSTGKEQLFREKVNKNLNEGIKEKTYTLTWSTDL